MEGMRKNSEEPRGRRRDPQCGDQAGGHREKDESGEASAGLEGDVVMRDDEGEGRVRVRPE